MVLLILGVALWWGAHLFKRLAPAQRAALGDKAEGPNDKLTKCDFHCAFLRGEWLARCQRN